MKKISPKQHPDPAALLHHHAQLLIGGTSEASDLIQKIWGALQSSTHHLIPTHTDSDVNLRANPDFTNRAYTNFTIDDARELKALAETRPVTSAAIKIFVLTMNSITIEAQNALLKVLEEPADYIRFFLIVPSLHLLLPTVKSRLSLINGNSDLTSKKSVSDDAQKFLAASPADRLALIKTLIDDISKEKRSKQDAVDFLNDVQAVLYARGDVRSAQNSFIAIETARRYITDRAPSLKMLLEHVALNI